MSAETLRGSTGAGDGGRRAVGQRGRRAVGTSRVTARRYLEHLAEAGLVARHRGTAAAAGPRSSTAGRGA